MEIEKKTSNYEKEEDFSFGTDEQINKLQMYLEENFNLASCATHMVGDILAYVAAQDEGSEELLDLLCALLDSTGIERSEIVHLSVSGSICVTRKGEHYEENKGFDK